MRLILRSATSLVLLASLGACATSHSAYEAPEGLVYACRGPNGVDLGIAEIRFNGQGYQPASTAPPSELPPTGSSTGGARSKAQLSFNGRTVEMMADRAYTGMLYRTIEPYGTNADLVWIEDEEAARMAQQPDGELQEAARLLQIARLGENEALAQPVRGEPVALCTRVRSLPDAGAAGEGVHGPVAEQPHRR